MDPRWALLPLLATLGCAPSAIPAPDAAIPDAATPDAAIPPDAAMPAPKTVRLLITLGSSSTAGSGAATTETRYVNRLASALGAQLINLGSGGQTVDQVQATYLPQALEALDTGPPPDGQVDLVTFLPFTDFAQRAPESLASSYDAVLTTLDGTHAWVIFGIPTIDADYVCGRGTSRGPDGECYGADLADEYDAKGSAVRTMLTAHPAASPADIPGTQAEHPDWSAPDGHPNDEGHAHIARHFLVEIARRLGRDGGIPLP